MRKMKMFRISPWWKESLHVAIGAIASNRLRSVLTILIIGIGITSLVGVLTVTDALNRRVMAGFDQMGSHSFTVGAKAYDVATSRRYRIKNERAVSYSQADALKKHFDLPAVVTVHAELGSTSVRSGNRRTDPNVVLVAADEDYLSWKNLTVGSGRGLMEQDARSGAFICLIGSKVARILFGREEPEGKTLIISTLRFRVVGVLQPDGKEYESSDLSVIVPLGVGRTYFAGPGQSFVVGITPQAVNDSGTAGAYSDRAEQLFRAIRRLTPRDAADFMIRKNDSLMENLQETTAGITLAGMVIGLITLLGAAVGLLNIMLVAVKERTREIGIRKALGASSVRIKQQFLMESVLIGEMGCALGIVSGVAIGNLTALLMEGRFVIPWGWMLLAVVICLLVGIASGYFPAVRAARLDPIEALRYE